MFVLQKRSFLEVNFIQTYSNSSENTFPGRPFCFFVQEKTGNKTQGDRCLIGCLPQEDRENDKSSVFLQMHLDRVSLDSG